MREDDLLGAEGRLYNLGIFDWAEIDPRRQITTQTEEDVLVKLHEARQNDIKYGFGFEVVNRGGSIPSGTIALPGLPPVGLPSTFQTSQKTFWGPRATFQYTRQQLSRLGRDADFRGVGREAGAARVCLLRESSFSSEPTGAQTSRFRASATVKIPSSHRAMGDLVSSWSGP